MKGATPSGRAASISNMARPISTPMVIDGAGFSFRVRLSTARGGNHHAHAPATLEHTLAFQLAVGTAHGHRIDCMVFGHLAHRGQALADAELAGGDETPHLLDDLAIDRIGRCGGNQEQRSIHVYQ